jgi:outer membrane protein, multidrug efflux system
MFVKPRRRLHPRISAWKRLRVAFFPQIRLSGTTGFQAVALASLFTPGGYWTLTVSLTQPSLDGFLLEGELK